MKQLVYLTLISISLILSACSGQQPSPTAATEDLMGSGNSPMDAGNMEMNSASGAATPTPGSMMPTNPEAAHVMEPIGGSNIAPATETKGGQPLAYREESGVKVFELTAKVVQWPILDGVRRPPGRTTAPYLGR